jgi:uncharacterized oxidoreductase
VIINADKLNQLVQEIFLSLDAQPAFAKEVADHLVAANLKGHDSHGVGMTPAYVKNLNAGLLQKDAEATVHKDNGAVMVIDGNFGFGQVVGRQACDMIMERVRDTGVVCAGVRNCHHLGRIGTYAEHCAAQGFISLHMVNVVGHNPLVAPFGGRERRFTTNPFTCAIPRDGEPPFVLDMATSAVAMGKVRVAHEAGLAAPEGALIDHEGVPTTDSTVMFQKPVGALVPFGNHKGYGLAVMCELLAGALAGEWTAQPENERNGHIVNHMFMVVLDPAAFGGLEAFQAETEAMINYLHSTEPAKGVDRVRIAGEPERESMSARSKAGIPLSDGAWHELSQAALAAGLDQTRIDATVA